MQPVSTHPVGACRNIDRHLCALRGKFAAATIIRAVDPERLGVRQGRLGNQGPELLLFLGQAVASAREGFRHAGDQE
jgi:hypothetical protein